MKFSEAMLRGYCHPEIQGRQECGGKYVDKEMNPTRVCVLGAANLGATGDAQSGWTFLNGDASDAFMEAWDVKPAELNDNGVDWRDIYGMAVAAGL